MNTVLNRYYSEPEPELNPEPKVDMPFETEEMKPLAHIQPEKDKEDGDEEDTKEKMDSVDTTPPPNMKDKQNFDKVCDVLCYRFHGLFFIVCCRF